MLNVPFAISYAAETISKFKIYKLPLQLIHVPQKKNIPLLMRYAKEFRVEKILRRYLEVLL